MTCTRCQQTGFLNAEQIPESVRSKGVEEVLRWIPDHPDTDVTICDCCGNGEDTWHGEPGQHYTSADPVGRNGPYSYNGGLCECH